MHHLAFPSHRAWSCVSLCFLASHGLSTRADPVHAFHRSRTTSPLATAMAMPIHPSTVPLCPSHVSRTSGLGSTSPVALGTFERDLEVVRPTNRAIQTGCCFGRGRDSLQGGLREGRRRRDTCVCRARSKAKGQASRKRTLGKERGGPGRVQGVGRDACDKVQAHVRGDVETCSPWKRSTEDVLPGTLRQPLRRHGKTTLHHEQRVRSTRSENGRRHA